jgi:hypothetical protein
MAWKKIGKNKWVNNAIKGTTNVAKITIETYKDMPDMFYVRQYNDNDYLLDSLAEGTYEKAEEMVKHWIKNPMRF